MQQAIVKSPLDPHTVTSYLETMPVPPPVSPSVASTLILSYEETEQQRKEKGGESKQRGVSTTRKKTMPDPFK